MARLITSLDDLPGKLIIAAYPLDEYTARLVLRDDDVGLDYYVTFTEHGLDESPIPLGEQYHAELISREEVQAELMRLTENCEWDKLAELSNQLATGGD